MKGLKKQLVIGLMAGVFSTCATWALRENAWLVLPVFIVCVMAIGWTCAYKLKRDWKKAALENTVNVTLEDMRALVKCKSREEFIVVCSIFCLDPCLLMQSYPFLRWDD